MTISNAGRLLELSRDRIAQMIWQDVQRVTGITTALPPWQLVRERRATFAATPDEIQLAIEKARGFLYSQQQPGGQWEKQDKRRGNSHDVGGMQGDTFGGFTAIATYALPRGVIEISNGSGNASFFGPRGKILCLVGSLMPATSV